MYMNNIVHHHTSFILGKILMTSPQRVFTTILLPTASMTSTESVFLQRKSHNESRLFMEPHEFVLGFLLMIIKVPDNHLSVLFFFFYLRTISYLKTHNLLKPLTHAHQGNA